MSTEEGNKSESANRFLKLVDGVIKLAHNKPMQEIGRKLWDAIISSPELTQSNQVEQSSVVSSALLSMQRGNAPRIALTGATDAGKSTLINKLFGQSLIETSSTPDTTGHIIRAGFQSGLMLYDTPGILSNGEYENITRSFLRLPQDSGLGEQVTYIPFQPDISDPSTFYDLSPEELPHKAPIDIVLWVVDLSQAPLRSTKTDLRNFFLELEKIYEDHLVIAGTKWDLLKSKPAGERAKILQIWGEVFTGYMIPVSANTGERLSDLVEALFRAASDDVSLAKLQEALVDSRKLNRLAFVITEVCKLLADVPFLSGKQKDEIRTIAITIFALICAHYSVDEQTWLAYNGDAFRIGAKAQKAGVSHNEVKRDPEGVWEAISAWFGKEYYKTVVEYEKLGIKGLEQMLPWVYQTLHSFASPNSSALPGRQIQQKMHEMRGSIRPLIVKQEKVKLATELGKNLSSWLGEHNS